MKAWAVLAAPPFVTYGFYLIGSGEAERRIAYGNERIGCHAAAHEAGLGDKAGSACNCLRSKRRRWQSRNEGAQFTEALEERYLQACIDDRLAAPVPLEDRSIVDDVFEQHKNPSDWGADPDLPQETGRDW